MELPAASQDSTSFPACLWLETARVEPIYATYIHGTSYTKLAFTWNLLYPADHAYPVTEMLGRDVLIHQS
jgi:hypothetical protein